MSSILITRSNTETEQITNRTPAHIIELHGGPGQYGPDTKLATLHPQQEGSLEGETVRKGIWKVFEPLKWDDEGWPEGEWHGMDGQIIAVTHCRDITKDGEITPAPPLD